MPELRKDPVIGRWVIVSTERAARPHEVEDDQTGFRSVECPFCVGNEAATPPEVLAFRADGSKRDGPGWSVRVVPNKYPALMIEGDIDPQTSGVYDTMNGVGAHEVVIEGVEHEREFSELAVAQVRDVLLAFRKRMRDLKRDRRFRYLMVFKNHGPRAGATLEHGHAQLIATPIVPKRVQEELEGAAEHFRRSGRCIFCDVIEQERREGVRLIAENDGYLSIAPFASRFPFETWLLPKSHSSHFEDDPLEALDGLAELLRLTLGLLRRTLDAPAYNFVLHTSPAHDDSLDHYHWHIEIMPRLTQVAGFEWGTGFFINSMPPEEAARQLREIHDRAHHA